MVWVTLETALPTNIVPEIVEVVYAETFAVPLVEGEIPVRHFQFTARPVPILVCMQFSVVLKMVRPLAGLTMASR